MNRMDLVAAVAEAAGLTKTDAGRAVDALFDSVVAGMKADGEVRLVGFGSFVVTERPEAQGRNPRTGETIVISASRQAKFKAGKLLKDALNSASA